MNKLRAFSALESRERTLLLRAWMMLGVIDLVLRAWSLPRVERLLAVAGREGGGPRYTTAELARQIERAARHHLWPMACLQRSLCLQVLLRRQGLTAPLEIGVSRRDGRLEAHAWLAVDGLPRAWSGAGFMPLVRSGWETDSGL